MGLKRKIRAKWCIVDSKQLFNINQAPMKETTPSAMPPCFEKWCKKFDDCFRTKAQKTGFRHYLGGLLGRSERKNITQMADNALGVVYNRLHHFMTDAPWE